MSAHRSTRSTRRWHTRLTTLTALTALVAPAAMLLLATPSRAAAEAPLLQVGSAPGLLSPSVTNKPPVASSFKLTTSFQQSTSADLAAHVSDPDGSDGYVETFTIGAPASHGTARLSGSQVTYAPTQGFSGPDAFSYRVCERGNFAGGHSCSRPTTVSVVVGAPASPTRVNQAEAAKPPTRPAAAGGTTQPTKANPTGATRPPAITAVGDEPTPSINLDPESGSPGTMVTASGTMVSPWTCDAEGNSIVFDESVVVRGVEARSGGASSTYRYSETFVVPFGTFIGTKSVEFRQDDCYIVDIGRPRLRSALNVGLGSRGLGISAPGTDYSAETDFEVTNRPPDAVPVELTTGFEEPGIAQLAASDPDGGDGYVESFRLTTRPAHGTATVSNDEVTYTPEQGYSGPDAFTYRVCERDKTKGLSCGEPATVSVTVGRPTPSITVTPAAGPPGTPVTVRGDLFGPDSCGESGNTIRFHGSTVVARVRARANDDGTFSYTERFVVPRGTFIGVAPVEIRQDDCGEGDGDVAAGPSATTEFDVTNRPPDASAVNLTTRFQRSVSADLAAHISDPDGNDGYAEMFTIADPIHGSATLTGSRVTYIPPGDFSGSDAFTYQVCESDNEAGALRCSQPALVSISVIPPEVDVSVAARPTTACTGRQVTVVARVTADNKPPSPRATVTFRMSMPGQVVRTVAATTDSAGRATVVYVRSTAGNDSVTVTANVPGAAQSRAAGPVAVRWTSCQGGAVPGTPPGNQPQVPTAPENPPPAGGAPSNPSLQATDPSPLPGNGNLAIGRGCAPQAPVDLRLGTVAVGSAQANTSGQFRIPFQVPSLPIGRHPLVATCGPVTIATPIDLVVTASTSGTSGAAVTTVVAVFLFFVLLGSQLLRPGLGSAGAVPSSL